MLVRYPLLNIAINKCVRNKINVMGSFRIVVILFISEIFV